MKQIITKALAAIMGVAGLAITASAQEDHEHVERQRESAYERRGPRFEDRRVFEHEDRGSRLDREVRHLNRMLAHVRAEMRASGANRRLWYQYQHIQNEAYRLNRMFRRGVQYYDRRRVRAQIEHMHDELHQIELQLRLRANRYYQWR